MKIYAISGLGADRRVFQFLTLEYDLIPLDWILPLKNEAISSYAKRLSQAIDTSEPFCILSVSFGGFVATEINKILQPELSILVSSVETKNELPLLYRLFGKLKLIPLLPKVFFQPPKQLMYWLFGTKQKQLLAKILDDTDLSFTKWAIGALVTWQNTAQNTNTVRIHGDADRLIPLNGSTPLYVVSSGTHFMIVDKAKEVSNCINEAIKSVTSNKK